GTPFSYGIWTIPRIPYLFLFFQVLTQNIVRHQAKENEKQSILDLFRKNLITSEDVELQLKKINDEKQD
ncbi:hypothetical protein J2S00_003098, partial [Caldalkalibacillus uzonensis]